MMIIRILLLIVGCLIISISPIVANDDDYDDDTMPSYIPTTHNGEFVHPLMFTRVGDILFQKGTQADQQAFLVLLERVLNNYNQRRSTAQDMKVMIGWLMTVIDYYKEVMAGNIINPYLAIYSFPNEHLRTDASCFSTRSNVITKYHLTNPNCPKDVVIPARINGHIITSLSNRSFTIHQERSDIQQQPGFSGSRSDYQLTSVILPETLYHIGNGAFSYNNLTSISFPPSVQKIHSSSFRNNFITSVSIPDGVKELGNSAFESNRITSLTLPSSLEIIGERTFANNRITSVTIPDNVVSIPQETFESNRITSLTFGPNIQHIGYRAFRNNMLTQFSLPASIQTVGSLAFQHNGPSRSHGADIIFTPGQAKTFELINNQRRRDQERVGLTNDDCFSVSSGGVIEGYQSFCPKNAVIPEEIDGVPIVGIGVSVFRYLNLTGISLPNSIRAIGARSFQHNSLGSITLPSSLEFIGSYAFQNSQINGRLVIPDGMRVIGHRTFQDNAINEVVFPQTLTTLSTNTFTNNQLTSVSLPNALTSVGDYSFDGNPLSGSASVSIPSSLTINTRVFPSGCTLSNGCIVRR